MKIGHVNIQSFGTNFPEFSDHLSANNYDILGVTETWLKPNCSSDNYNTPGYKLIRNDRVEGRGGGVAFYIGDNLSCKLIKYDIYQSTKTMEQLWISFKMGDLNVAVGVIYKLRGSTSNDFLDEFENILSNVIIHYDKIICLGDFNINWLNTNDSTAKKLIALTKAYGFEQIITKPTRYNNLIDFIFISDVESLIMSDVLDMQGVTDHRLTYCELDFPSVKPKPKITTFRDYKYFCHEDFVSDLVTRPWFMLYYYNDIDSKVKFLNEQIIEVMDRHAPLRTVQVRKPPAPWLTDVIRQMMKLRDRAHVKAKKTGLPSDWDYYVSLRNYTTGAIRREKKAYVEYVSKQNQSKTFWKTVKLFNINKKSEVCVPENLADVEAINNHFINCTQFPLPKTDEIIQYYKTNSNRTNDSFSFKQVTTGELNKIIFQLKSDAVGVDCLNLKMIRLCIPHISEYLEHVINYCLVNAVVPHVWKEALVTPICKNKDPKEFNDLRPISILPTLSKILEKIVDMQFRSYLDKCNIIPNIQSGFRRHHSTTTALLHITDEIINACDKGKTTMLVLLDYSKAFDTINHEILCAKLEHYNFDNNSVNFIKSYLSDRTQKVKLNGEMSTSLAVVKGVPQGSVLGPLLFCIYTADLCQKVKYMDMHCYADDTQLLFSFPSASDLVINNVNSDLNDISNFSTKLHLKINPKKSFVMLFGKDRDQNIQVKMNGELLPVVTECRNLGLIIDSDLRFKTHINKLLQRAYGTLKLLYSQKQLLSKDIILKLSEALILSVFDYCDAVYGPCIDAETRNRIQILQNCCVRFALKINRRQHITPFYKNIKWLKMEQRRLYHLGCLAHSIMLKKSPSYLFDKLISRKNIHGLNLRCSGLNIPQHSTAMFQRSFVYSAVTIYNGIPQEIKKCSMINFKKRLYNYLLHGN